MHCVGKNVVLLNLKAEMFDSTCFQTIIYHGRNVLGH